MNSAVYKYLSLVSNKSVLNWTKVCQLLRYSSWNPIAWKQSCLQSSRWQHLSHLKASAFLSLHEKIVVKKFNNLYLGLVMPSRAIQSKFSKINSKTEFKNNLFKYLIKHQFQFDIFVSRSIKYLNISNNQTSNNRTFSSSNLKLTSIWHF